MKIFILFGALIAMLGLISGSTSPEEKMELPSLHIIKEATLSPCYSCRSPEDFAQGYVNTALFLSEVGRKRNEPDLVFNGTPGSGSQDYFEAAGDEMSLVADLGPKLPLEDVSALRAFNLERVHSFPAYTRFASVAKVEANHTYAVVLNSTERRGLFVFRVTDYIPNKKVSLEYAVEAYQMNGRSAWASSPGFGWETGNSR
jgi:hypothetical protein